MPSATRFFVLTGALFGAALVFLTPPFMVPDEFQHTFRAWQLSRGVLLPPVGDGGHVVARVPRSFADMAAPLYSVPFHPERKVAPSLLRDEMQRRLDPADLVTVVIDDMRGKSPLVHAAPAVGLALAGLLRLPPIACLWLARAANFAVWLALAATAIRWLPRGRWTLALVALLPMSLYEAASTSADAVTNGVAWLFFAAVVAAAAGDGQRTQRREPATVTVVAAILAQCKQLYVLLVPLVFLVPRSRFASSRRYRLAIAAPLAAAAGSLGALTLALAWNGTPPRAFAWAAADPALQLAGIAGDPLRFLGTLSASLAGFDWRGMIGSLGWNDASLPPAVGTVGLVLLLVVAVADGGGGKTAWQRLVAAISAVMVVAAVATALYLVFTPVGDPRVNGLQGRYFLPALPAFLYSLQARSRPLGRGWVEALTICGALLLNAAGVAVVMSRFYPG